MSKTYIIGIDNIQGGQDSTTLATVVKVVEDAGNTVINAGVGPNVVQSKQNLLVVMLWCKLQVEDVLELVQTSAKE